MYAPTKAKRPVSLVCLLYPHWNDSRDLKKGLRQHGARLSDSLKDPSFAAFCAEHARKCPLCHVVIFRPSGCDHMVCKCGHSWNWKDKEAVVAN